MQKMLIVGEGYVGRAIRDAASTAFEVKSIRYDPCDFEDNARALGELPAEDAAWVVNVTGYCGVANVEDCELDPAHTWYANYGVAVHAATACARYGLRLFHVSSGCIFNGVDGIVTTGASPNPIGAYQKSKAEAERAIRDIDPAFIIGRIRMPFSNTDCRRNYLSKFISHQEIWHSPPYSMSHLPDMARLMVGDMLANRGGIKHYVNSGSQTNSELALRLANSGLMPFRQVVTGRSRSYAVLEPHPLAESLDHALSEAVDTWRWR